MIPYRAQATSGRTTVRRVLCEFCSFDWDQSPLTSIATLASMQGTIFLPVDVSLVTRPSAGVWSILEYIAHLRDAIGFYEARIGRILAAAEPPVLPLFDPDEACTRGRYAEADPDEALRDAVQAGRELSELLGSLGAHGWEKSGIGSEGCPRTVSSLASRAAHEVTHHVVDVTTIAGALRRPAST